MDSLRTTVLLVATLTLGLMAGLFYAYAGSVMPGLRRAADRTVVDAMQRINVAIQNPLFLVLFLGGLLFTGAAAVLHAGRGDVLVPLLAALVLYALTLVVTFTVNIPLNNRLAAAGPVERIADPAAVRAAFYDRWVRWNTVRTVTSTGAFAAACWAVLRHGGL